jgi:hypothetical protein
MYSSAGSDDRGFENHEAVVALHFMCYDFGRVHQTLRVLLAMEAGIAGHAWAWAGSWPW